jgi:hypothetical protein
MYYKTRRSFNESSSKASNDTHYVGGKRVKVLPMGDKSTKIRNKVAKLKVVK